MTIFDRPIAHRGLHDLRCGVVENSLSAARQAIAHDYGIECDVQLSLDGEAVVFHDFTLKRLCGINGCVADYTAKDLGEFLLAGSADAIPTLTQFIDIIAGRVPLIIEIKSAFRGDLRLTQRVAEIVSEAPCTIVVKSFDPACITELARIAPQISRGIVGMKSYECGEFAHLDDCHKFNLSNLLHVQDTLPDFISWRFEDLAELKRLTEQLNLNLPVFTWTIKNEHQKKMAKHHANQIIFEDFLPESILS